MDIKSSTLPNFSNQPSNTATHSDLKAVAEQFEAIFVEQFLKAARQSELSDGLFDSSEGDTYRDMLDKEYAKSIAGNTTLGIANAIEAKFSRFLEKE